MKKQNLHRAGKKRKKEWQIASWATCRITWYLRYSKAGTQPTVYFVLTKRRRSRRNKRLCGGVCTSYVPCFLKEFGDWWLERLLLWKRGTLVSCTKARSLKRMSCRATRVPEHFLGENERILKKRDWLCLHASFSWNFGAQTNKTFAGFEKKIVNNNTTNGRLLRGSWLKEDKPPPEIGFGAICWRERNR